MENKKKFGTKALLWVSAVLVVTAVAVVGLWNPLLGAKAPVEPETPEEVVAGAEGHGYEVPLDVDFPNTQYEDIEVNTGDEGAKDQNPDAPLFFPIQEKLTWERLNSFPIKYPGMPIQEMRQYCADFFRFAKTALWSPKEDMTYYTSDEKTSTYTMYAGNVYGGVPYIGLGSGSVYRLMDFLDEENGTVDTAKYVKGEQTTSRIFTKSDMKFFGNQCSIGSYWGWARVMNSADFKWTQNVVTGNKFLLHGEYDGYTDINGNDIHSVPSWKDNSQAVDKHKNHHTTAVCEAVGDQQMFRNYAQLKLADGLVYYTTAGHLVMSTSDAVVYDTNGNRVTDLSMENLKNITIDGTASYILMTDQATKWLTGTSAQGDRFLYEDGVDAKRTFKSLYNGSYIPFTYKEFVGQDPVEETECAFSHTGSTITWSQLVNGKVTANYGISDIYVSVTNDKGEEVYRYIVRTPSAGNFTLNMKEDTGNPGNITVLGNLETGTYNVEIAVQLGTGERPIVYTGTLKV